MKQEGGSTQVFNY